jgi:hypothetical protein
MAHAAPLFSYWFPISTGKFIRGDRRWLLVYAFTHFVVCDSDTRRRVPVGRGCDVTILLCLGNTAACGARPRGGWLVFLSVGVMMRLMMRPSPPAGVSTLFLSNSYRFGVACPLPYLAFLRASQRDDPENFGQRTTRDVPLRWARCMSQ